MAQLRRALLCAFTGVVVLLARPAYAGAQPARDVAAIERDCRAGDAAACGDLGERYVRGRGVKRDVARGAALFERSCEAGHFLSCRMLGMLLLPSPDSPPGFRLDPARAQALLKRACEGGNGAACGDLAVRNESGDKERTLALYLKGCELTSALACWNGAQFLLRERNDRTGADRLLEKACNVDGEWQAASIAALACTTLAREREGQDAAQASKLRGRATQLIQDACGVSGWACGQLAPMYEQGDGVPRDPARAEQLWKRYAAEVEQGCEEGLNIVCSMAGSLYAEGKGVPKDPERAQKLRQRAADGLREVCERALDPGACSMVARMDEQGEGVERDLARAAVFYGQACQAKDEMACREEKRLRPPTPAP